MESNLAKASERPFVLVLGLDLADQDSSGYAFDAAIRIVSRIPGSEMHVVHVVGPDVGVEASQQAAGLLRLYVSEKAAALGLAGPQRAGMHVRRGEAAKEI